VDPTARLDDLENRKFMTLPGLELRPLSRPARGQSLYRLRYPESLPVTSFITSNYKMYLHLYTYYNLMSFICFSWLGFCIPSPTYVIQMQNYIL
jgi:hypothetical protein